MPKFIEILINGAAIKFDVDELIISEPESERSRSSAQEAWWAHVWAAAEAEGQRLEAQAEQWLNKAMAQMLDDDAKVAEWKAKAVARGSDQYLRLVLKSTDAKEMARRVWGILDAWRRKADMLRSMIPSEVSRWYHAGDVGKSADKDQRFDVAVKAAKSRKQSAQQQKEE